jgi:phosphoribosyl-AMP cyclohydrolase
MRIKRNIFSDRKTIEQVEEGMELAPKFDSFGLIPVVATDYATGELLMHGYMNEEALEKTIVIGQMHYYSRSREVIWHKGATSGFFQNVKELHIDDDQDAIWAKVEVLGGASCHVGYRTCFYRKIDYTDGNVGLLFTDKEKVFDPKTVYGDEVNPTKL